VYFVILNPLNLTTGVPAVATRSIKQFLLGNGDCDATIKNLPLSGHVMLLPYIRAYKPTLKLKKN